MNKDNNFENNLKKLESIVEKLENGEVDLEESVKLYDCLLYTSDAADD